MHLKVVLLGKRGGYSGIIEKQEMKLMTSQWTAIAEVADFYNGSRFQMYEVSMEIFSDVSYIDGYFPARMPGIKYWKLQGTFCFFFFFVERLIGKF